MIRYTFAAVVIGMTSLVSVSAAEPQGNVSEVAASDRLAAVQSAIAKVLAF